ncbi:hypothetical protein BJ944DRAFT_269188, partial [Cunninghamella echinulata]
SLRKTKLILQSMEKKQKQVTYYALDLDQFELEKSLSSLGGQFQHVQLFGLLGTYEQGIPWLSQQYTSRNTPKMVLWLGSSIGNQSRRESAVFLRKLQRTCLQPGDLFVIGFDRRNDASIISKAYHDSEGVTEQFIMNGLNHINTILGQSLFNLDDFEYYSIYQEHQGRHVAHYRAKKDMQLVYQRKNNNSNINENINKKRRVLDDNNNNDTTIRIFIEKGELIHVEHSYKYDDKDISHILNTSELNMVEKWQDSKHLYQLVLAECRPFHFERDNQHTIQTLFPQEEKKNQHQHQDELLGCTVCDTDILMNQQQQIMEQKSSSMASDSLINIIGNKHWPSSVPTLHEWEQLWASWDMVTRQMLNHDTMLFERPIALRHPFIFYLGHIPAFLDIMITRHQTDREVLDNHHGKSGDNKKVTSQFTEPSVFTEIFERGIDPDMDDPTQCNPHSDVPVNDQDWPSVNSILLYQQSVRLRLRKILLFWEAESYQHATNWLIPSRQRDARVVWMCFEHEAMHLETLLYMLLQSPNIHCPPVAPPSWYLTLHEQQKEKYEEIEEIKSLVLSKAPMIPFSEGMVDIGHDDYLNMDGKLQDINEFGWDNEHPKRSHSVSAFEIQSRPITNGEYWVFWNNIQDEREKETFLPASWKLDNVKTIALHWPVQVSYQQAVKYTSSLNDNTLRIPTEEEWIHFRHTIEATIPMKDQDKSSLNNEIGLKGRDIPNVGFASWTPTSLNNEQIHTVGDVWEWTRFTASELYPGYSADFFDDKHHIVLGGSWATHPRISERSTAYPYVFSGFRLCRSL